MSPEEPEVVEIVVAGENKENNNAYAKPGACKFPKGLSHGSPLKNESRPALTLPLPSKEIIRIFAQMRMLRYIPAYTGLCLLLVFQAKISKADWHNHFLQEIKEIELRNSKDVCIDAISLSLAVEQTATSTLVEPLPLHKIPCFMLNEQEREHYLPDKTYRFLLSQPAMAP